MEQFPATNPNPVLSVAVDGTVLYTNTAGEPLLHEWGATVGEKLPSDIGDFVQIVISRNSPEKMEVKAGKKVYLVVFHPLPEQKCVNVSGFDISDQKQLEGKYSNIVENPPFQALLNENHTLKNEIQNLRARLEEPEELQRAISEGDLDGLVMPVSKEDLSVFIFDNADRAYRTLVETANEGIWITNSEANTTYVNEKMAEMLGYNQKEIIGKSSCNFTDEEGQALEELNLEMRRQGISEVHESKLICKDGSSLWLLVSSKSLFNNDGEFTGSLNMLTDITERKQAEKMLRESEARFRSVLDGSNDVIYRVNMQSNSYEYISPSVEALIGFTQDEATTIDAETGLSMIHPDDLPAMRAAIEHLKETGKSNAEYRQRTKNSDYIWISNHMSLTKDSEGNHCTGTATFAILSTASRRRKLYKNQKISIEPCLTQ